MGFKFNPLSGDLDLVGSGGGATVQSPNYFSAFNNTTDWSGPSGGIYTLTKAAATHGKGLHPIVQVWENLGGGQYTIVDITCKINSSGDVTLEVLDSPDLRFQGVLVVSENN